jgi:histidine triad (HIT) family protein
MNNAGNGSDEFGRPGKRDHMPIACIFCKLGQEVPSGDKLFDDGVVYAIRDIAPKARVHVLLIPHEHIEGLVNALPDQVAIAAHCLEVAPKLAQAEGLAETGYRLVVNQGQDSGQEVPHFHLHVLGGHSLGAMG